MKVHSEPEQTRQGLDLLSATRPIRARRVKQSEVRTEMCRDLIPFSNKSAATPADATGRGARGMACRCL
jgi:hypothetical protein